MAKLEIKVGASVDRNLAVAYRPVVDGAKRAAAAVEAEQKKAAKAAEREAKKAADAEKKAAEQAARAKIREEEKWARTRANIQNRSATMAGQMAVREIKDAERAAAAKIRADKRASDEQERNRARAHAKWVRDNEKAMREHAKLQREAARETSAMHSRMGRNAFGIARSGVGMAAGIAASLARSQGVDLSAESIFRKNADLETSAQQLSNSGYMAGDARNGRRIGTRELMNQALDVGSRTGTDANKVLGGLQNFVGLTGDLQTGRDIMEDLLKLSKATGSEFEDMASAAGNVAANLPDTADKGERVKAVMMAIAGQGKVGAVEIKDLAAQMAKLAANAGQFEGDVGKNIVTLGAMAQEARAKGTAASATQAATSVASFVSMLKTPKRAAEFEKATGTSVIDKKTGMLRDPEKIIQEALAKVGMDPIALKNIFANVQGARAMEGFATVFRTAGGGKAGADAVTAEFQRLRNATISAAEVEESFARSMKTGQSQAEVFNQEMRKNALAMQDALLPAVLALAPVIVEATKDLANLSAAIFGGDKVEKNIAEGNTKARNVLDSAAKQAAGGQISTVTKNEMAKEAFEMKSAVDLARSDLDDAKKGRSTGLKRGAIKGFDYTPVGAVLGMMGGGSFGSGLGTAALDKEDLNINKKQAALNETERLYQEVVNGNKTLQQRIDQGLLVIVKNADEIKGGTGAPGISPAGRKPTPEQNSGME